MTVSKKLSVTALLMAIFTAFFGVYIAVCSSVYSVKAVTKQDVKAFGIDLSYYQSDVDYGAVHTGGVDFVIARVSYTVKFVDSSFARHIDGCTEAGIDVGAYIYSEAATVSDAHKEAEFVIGAFQSYGYTPQTFTYPIYFDYEHGKVSSLSASANTAIINAFCHDISASGYYPGLYMGGYLYKNKVNKSALCNVALWIAAYGGGKNPSWKTAETYIEGVGEGDGKVGMWQYSCTGGINGYSGDVDKNYCFTDYPTLIKSGALNNVSAVNLEADNSVTPTDNVPSYADNTGCTSFALYHSAYLLVLSSIICLPIIFIKLKTKQ